jgi:APA family basic amino acid/polyamine antiporter
MSEEKSQNDASSSGGSKKKMGFMEAITARYNKVDPHSYLRKPDETGFNYWTRRLIQIKPVELLWAESENSELKRALNAIQLVAVGIGAIIGKIFHHI